ncbi:MAG: ABC transporter substrate-binding protein [Motiliproteus sp.]|nr:ABC transporter substrate-binding protein [Motiliproteus sp.]MCW9051010.1 ABC transporter substrate-binding protein [Motiliproteus sp.]
MIPLKRIFVSLFLSLLLAVPAQASWMEARELVDGATQEMVKLLGDPSLKEESAFPQLFDGVDNVLTPVVDFDRIARGVMAKYYRQANDDQRARFAGVFKNALVKTYAKALAAFSFDRYEIVKNVKPSKKPKKQTVKVDVFGVDGNKYQLIYFVLQGKTGEWKITNVHMDGINLRQIFKNQFAEAVNGRKGDIDQVIEAWADLVDTSPAKGS